MKLQLASEMKKVAESNFEKMKADALESDDFKSIVQGIEKKSDQGRREHFYFNNTDKLLVDIFKQLLLESGYKVKKHESGLSLNIEW